MVPSEFGKETSSRLLHALKAYSPISLIPSGIMIEDKLLA